MTETREIPAVTPAKAVAVYNRILKRGEQSWQDWTTVLGPWIAERIQVAQAKARGTRGPTYAHTLQRALGPESFYPIYKKLSDNGTMSFLMRCLEKLDEVNAMRNRLPEDDRPSHPRRVWEAYEASLRSTIDFGRSDEDEDDDEKSERQSGPRRSNREPELLAEIEKLSEQLDEHRMSIYPEMNAQRVWRRLVDVVGADKAASLALATAEELKAIAKRVLAATSESPEPMFDE